MNKEEVEKILSEGSSNPKYQMALDIAKKNGWNSKRNITEEKLPEEKPKKTFKEKAKEIKDKLVMTPEETQKMTSERADVKNAARRSQISNPRVGVVDRVTGNVTGMNENILDPFAVKAQDLNSDGSVKGKDLQLGKAPEGKFIGAEEEKGSSSSGGSGSKSGIDKNTQSYLDKNNAIANTVEKTALDKLLKNSDSNWKQMVDTSAKIRNAYDNIDDKLVAQLPTFIFRRYSNGEFGDPKSADAKLRMAHFMINGLGSALTNASNVIKGKQLEESDYEKYQNSNLEQGLANRWKKNNAETDEVIKIANKEADNEQDARIYVEQLTRDNMLKSGWDAMDQNQKLYAINVSREIGKMIGDMNVEDLSNFITAQALNGNLSEQQAVVVGIASLVSKAPELIDKIPEGPTKNLILSILGTK
jgi:hypothetical protein